jgi:hypothetical protein
VFILLLCVPAVAPWREDGPSPTDRVAHVAACFAPPLRRRRLCADHRVEPYACRCRCRRPRARAPLAVTTGCPNGHAHAALSCEHRPFPVAP